MAHDALRRDRALKLLRGPGHPIESKLENARAIHAQARDELLKAPGMDALLARYREAVRENWEAMQIHGVVEHCTDCAVNQGGSCCGKGIEDKFDAALLILNLLLDAELPTERFDPEGCWFLGARGCTIPARHVICINYMCKRLYENIAPEGLHAVQFAMGQEADLLFMLEERIKGRLQQLGY